MNAYTPIYSGNNTPDLRDAGVLTGDAIIGITKGDGMDILVAAQTLISRNLLRKSGFRVTDTGQSVSFPDYTENILKEQKDSA